LHNSDVRCSIASTSTLIQGVCFPRASGSTDAGSGWHWDCSARTLRTWSGASTPSRCPFFRTSPKRLPSQFPVLFAVANCW